MDLNEIKRKRKEAQQRAEKAAADKARQAQSDNIKNAVEDNAAMNARSSARVTTAVNKSASALTEEIKNNSKNIADALASQNAGMTDALNNLVIATVMARDPKLVEVVSNFTTLLDNLGAAGAKLDTNPLNDLPGVNKQLVKALQDFTKQDGPPDYSAKFDALEKAIKAQDLKPTINVPKSDPKVDLAPITKGLDDVKAAIVANKVKLPEVKFDEVVAGLNDVQKTIAGLSFPVPNYVLPFKDSNGKATQVQLDSSGNVPITGSAGGGGGDGAILDGATSSIKATVKNYTNANPLTVRLSDTNGDYVAAGAGTQYTEDAAAAADPVGSMLMAVRRDTLSASEVSADGDNIALKATNKGQMHVKLADTVTVDASGVAVPVTDNGGSLTVDGAVTANNPSDTAPATQNITAADVATTSTNQQNSQAAITGNPTANSAATFAVSALDSVLLQVTGTWVGTLVIEYSMDGGTTYFTRGIHLSGTNYTAASITANATGNMNTAGATHVRVRSTAYVSGTAVVRLVGSINPSAFYLVNTPQIADGTTPSQKLAIDSGGSASVNQAKVAGTATSVNNGTVDAGTQRVTLASDSTGQVKSTNLPTTVDTNSGNKSASTLRVVLATDQPALTNKLLVTPDSVALPANQSVNVNQIAGTATSVNSGTKDAGTQRQVIATDNPAIATWGQGATGAAVPSGAQYNGYNAATALPSAATAGNLTGGMVDKYGRQVVIPGTIRDLIGTQTTTISASTSETTIGTAVASTFLDLVLLTVANTSATAARIDFRDTTGGSVLFSIYVPAGETRGFVPSRPIPQTSVNTNWTAQSSASVTDLRIYIQFEKNK